ncbi:hypothetical protein Ancab_024745 [Ancistrocladus abbreviatus]
MEGVFDKFEISFADTLIKVAVFLLVQALVYLILSNSSDIFSNKKMVRSFSFKPAGSSTIRRILSLVSDYPPVNESPESVGVAEPRSEPTYTDADADADADDEY